MDHPDIEDARDVWPEIINHAHHSVEIASFYVRASGTEALESTLKAIQSAAARGVQVRMLLDSKLAGSYQPSIRRLQAMHGVQVAVWDAEKILGGVHHAKYMVIDAQVLFVGSQNLDDRSLEHIEELGIWGQCPDLARPLRGIFNQDWAYATGKGKTPRQGLSWPREVALVGGGTVTLSASPPSFLPHGAVGDLDAIVRLVESATQSVELQMLSFRPRYRNGRPFTRISSALINAASRGVRVRLLVSDWMKKERDQADLQALAEAGIEVRVISIPAWSGGEIPFARVAHAKILVIDADQAWIGTSNGEGDYFLRGRNVGVVVRGGTIPTRVHRWFEDGWRLGRLHRKSP